MTGFDWSRPGRAFIASSDPIDAGEHRPGDHQALTALLASAGWHVLNHTPEPDAACSIEWLRADIAQLAAADAMFCTPGWAWWEHRGGHLAATVACSLLIPARRVTRAEIDTMTLRTDSEGELWHR